MIQGLVGERIVFLFKVASMQFFAVREIPLLGKLRLPSTRRKIGHGHRYFDNFTHNSMRSQVGCTFSVVNGL